MVASYGTCNRFGARIPINDHWNLDLLQNLLVNYWDAEVVEWLRYGWPVNRSFHLPDPIINITNHSGAMSFPEDIDNYIAQEIAEQAMYGPFLAIPYQTRVQISPLNSRLKKSGSKRRTLLDLSWPVTGGSVNEGIPKESYLGQPCKLTYPTVDDLANRIESLTGTVKIYSVDMYKAYRQLKICPLDYPLLGMYWKGFYFFDCNSPMGLRSASLFCQRTTLSFRYIHNSMGYFLMVYLDDLTGCEEENKVYRAYDALICLMRDLKVRLSEDKICPPTTCAEVLGIWFDTILKIMAVTPQKIEETLRLLDVWRYKVFATKKEFQSLVGKLQFLAKCVRPGRVLVSRLLNQMNKMDDFTLQEIEQEARLDLKWWYNFLPKFSGVSVLKTKDCMLSGIDLASDATLFAGGAWFSRPKGNDRSYEYIHCQFPQFILEQTSHISQRELLMVVVSLKMWGKWLKGLKFVVKSDNQASVVCLNSGRTKDAFMQACLREICYIAAIHNFEFRAVFIGTKHNVLPDLLSRWYEGSKARREFRRLIAGLRPTRRWVDQKQFTFENDW